MVHTFCIHGAHYAFDSESGALHSLHQKAAEMISRLPLPLPEQCPQEWVGRLGGEANAIWREIKALAASGQLFAPEIGPPSQGKPVVKAICLHVAHDCNLRCAYCFAGTGGFGADRALMTPETARKAIDFLLAQSGRRRHLEVDFFGGEPLMAWDTVVEAVSYGRARAASMQKVIRFTLTTNGLALDDDKIQTINAEMDKLVLSLDGREAVHNALRKTVSGEGSYRAVLPKMQRLVAARTRSYYLRGTFTANNLDFAEDVAALADLGFRHISIEPVVLPNGHPLAIGPQHIQTIADQYHHLLSLLNQRSEIDFFHFRVDLQGGPCLYKRVKGCGAGTEYAAVTPDGGIYPCHQFVGYPQYKIGTLDDFDLRNAPRFGNLFTRPACRTCWAKYLCGGGCAAANLTVNGDPEQPYQLGCDLARARFECALAKKR